MYAIRCQGCHKQILPGRNVMVLTFYQTTEDAKLVPAPEMADVPIENLATCCPACVIRVAEALAQGKQP